MGLVSQSNKIKYRLILYSIVLIPEPENVTPGEQWRRKSRDEVPAHTWGVQRGENAEEEIDMDGVPGFPGFPILTQNWRTHGKLLPSHGLL